MPSVERVSPGQGLSSGCGCGADAPDAQNAGRFRVVLVDDHEIVLEGLARSLRRTGFDVLGAFVDPVEAGAFIDIEEVDLLVLDLRLGEKSGVDVVKSLHSRYPKLRIAVLTSFEDGAAAAAVIRAGARGFLVKDTAAGELVERLRSIAEGNLVVDSRVATAVLEPEASPLTNLELVILNLVASGMTNRQIGGELHLSPYTIKDHLRRTMRRLGTTTRAETVARAVREGLLCQGGDAY